MIPRPVSVVRARGLPDWPSGRDPEPPSGLKRLQPIASWIAQCKSQNVHVARSRRAGPEFVLSLPTPACERTHRPERERAYWKAKTIPILVAPGRDCQALRHAVEKFRWRVSSNVFRQGTPASRQTSGR